VSPVQPPLPAVPPPTRELPTVPTGPVDWMPLPPDPAPAEPPEQRAVVEPVDQPGPADDAVPADDAAPAGATAARRRPRVRLARVPRVRRSGPVGVRRPVAAGLGVVAVLLLEVGLLMHEAGRTVWSRSPLWSAFATAAAVAGLAAVAGVRAAAPLRDRAWTLGAGGFTGLAVFWVLVALPAADTDRGFVLTAALACLGGAVWLTSGRTSGAAGAADPESGAVAEPAATT
jgi:hypothetical protein